MLKKIKVILASLILVCCIFSPIGAMGVENTDKNDFDTTEFVQMAEQLLESRSSLATINPIVGKDNYFQTDHNNLVESRQRELIIAHKDLMNLVGVQYTNSRTDVTVLDILEANDSRVIILVKEVTTLTMTGFDASESSYSAEHEFVFVKSGENWVLSENRQLTSGDFLLPDDQADIFLYGSGKSPFTRIQPVDVSKIAPPDDLAQRQSLNSLTINSRSTGYNRINARNYAETYYENYNPAYRSWEYDGGDCTNFISQSLYAGGWQNANGLWISTSSWWYGITNQTRTWVNAEYWSTFAISSGRVTVLNSVWDVMVGDIIQYKSVNGGDKEHSMIVTYIGEGRQPMLTYHNNNTLRRPLSSILAGNTDKVFYAYRVNT